MVLMALQQYAAQPGQYTGAGEAHPPAQEAPAYYQQTAPQVQFPAVAHAAISFTQS